jgi:molybdate transport system substrate-binding protein
MVFAAASTTDVIGEAARRYEAQSGVRVVCSFGGSSNLARQIMAGAPAEVYVSADQAWMDALEAEALIEAGSRVDLMVNALVLVAPAGSGFEVDFAGAPPDLRRIAVGDTAHVPAGRYAKEALDSLSWWSALEARLLPAQDVRAALRLVELGEADAGIIYASDARASDEVVIVASFPPESHVPIRYPVALCAGASDAAREFVEFLGSPEMAEVFGQAGFSDAQR